MPAKCWSCWCARIFGWFHPHLRRFHLDSWASSLWHRQGLSKSFPWHVSRARSRSREGVTTKHEWRKFIFTDSGDILRGESFVNRSQFGEESWHLLPKRSALIWSPGSASLRSSNFADHFCLCVCVHATAELLPMALVCDRVSGFKWCCEASLHDSTTSDGLSRGLSNNFCKSIRQNLTLWYMRCAGTCAQKLPDSDTKHNTHKAHRIRRTHGPRNRQILKQLLSPSLSHTSLSIWTHANRAMQVFFHTSQSRVRGLARETNKNVSNTPSSRGT